MLKHNDPKNTELTSAPKTSARTQPNVFLDDCFLEIWKGLKNFEFSQFPRISPLSLSCN